MKKDKYIYNPLETCPNKDCGQFLGQNYDEVQTEDRQDVGYYVLSYIYCGWEEPYYCFTCARNSGTEQKSNYCGDCTRNEVVQEVG